MTNKAAFITNKKYPNYNPVGKCHWLLDTLCKNYRAHYNPSPFVCVDESIIANNGRFCGIKQFMPAKPITHGIKLWALGCSTSRYVLRLEVYVGTTVEPGPITRGFKYGSRAGIVSRLLHYMDGYWYIVATDNFFTSSELFEDLLLQGFYAVGIVQLDRIGIPKSLFIGTTEARGTMHIRMHRDRKMACMHWSDCKGVRFLSTVVDPISLETIVWRNSCASNLKVSAPPMHILYSSNMRGIDVEDQLRQSYSATLATKKMVA